MENRPFAVWQVSEDESVKLVLEAKQICELEEKLSKGGSLLSVISSVDSGLPPLNVMLTVTKYASTRFNHGKQLEDIYALYDKYVAGGGNQLDFYANVYMQIFVASGFFTKSQAESMAAALTGMAD